MNLVTITHELASGQEIQRSDFLKELCTSTIAMYPNGAPIPPWSGYLAEEQGVFIGTCAFKAPPESGEVEIAYFTFPEHEGRGVASLMAKSLIELAIKHSVVKIKAQTLPGKNASTRILEKLGFEFSGSIVHPTDGEVWEWYKSGAA
ncbi:MAG: GNAT family N-acetyltransferase [Pseudomonadota bacterium]